MNYEQEVKKVYPIAYSEQDIYDNWHIRIGNENSSRDYIGYSQVSESNAWASAYYNLQANYKL